MTQPRDSASTPTDLDDSTALGALVDASARAVGLSIDPGSRPLVIEHLGRLLTAAGVVAERELPETTEPAPVFRP